MLIVVGAAVLGVLEETLPAGPLLGLGTASEHRGAERRVDVLTVDEQVGGAGSGHGQTLATEVPGQATLDTCATLNKMWTPRGRDGQVRA